MLRLWFLVGWLIGISASSIAQGIRVTGTLSKAEDGTPLPGGSVMVQGTTLGTITDFQGKYAITVPESARVLIFSFVGRQTENVSIDGQTEIDVVLGPDALGLDEVMVVAYGTAEKSSFTGSAETVSKDKIENIQATSWTKLLEGTVAGLQVSSPSGQPGSDAQILIRGIGTFSGSNGPLLVLDGFPFVGHWNYINPDDIESITVLKDATAGALYGARGANGVIVITTRKGHKGKPDINFKIRQGWSDRSIPEYPRINQQQYYEKFWEAYRNMLYYGADYSLEEAAEKASFGVDDDGKSTNIVAQLGNYNAYNLNPNQLVGTDGQLNQDATLLWQDDWEEELFRIAPKQDYNLSVSGGSEKTVYLISLGYLKEDGLLEYSDFERFTGRVGVESQLNKWLKLGLNTAFSSYTTNQFDERLDSNTNPFSLTRTMGPIYPFYAYHTWNQADAGSNIYNPDGSRVLDEGSGQITFDDGRGNIVQGLRPWEGKVNLMNALKYNEESKMREGVSARTFIELTPLPGLKLTLNLSVDFGSTLYKQYLDPRYGYVESYGYVGRYNSRRLYSTFNQLIAYTRLISDHQFDLLLGHENYSMTYNMLAASREEIPFPGLTELAGAAIEYTSNSYEDKDKIESFFGRINYDYSNRFYFSGSLRRDGSSRFYSESRWGTFWSTGVSWRISQENFYKVSWMNNLKLKASYGVQGNNDGIGYYPWQGLYDLGRDNNIYSGALASSLELHNLKWEQHNNLNVGLEFALLDRIHGGIDYFIRRSDNLLFEVPQPRSNGIDLKWENVGMMENRGIEARLSANLIRTEEFRWNFDVNVTHYKNEILSLPQEEIIVGKRNFKVGQSIYDFYLWEYAGAEAEEGVAFYWEDEFEEDQEGEPILDEKGETIPTGNRLLNDDPANASRYYLGSCLPTLFGGATSSLEFKGFDLSIFVTYSLGGKFYDQNYQQLMECKTGKAFHRDIMESWTESVSPEGLPTGTDTEGNTISYIPELIPRTEIGLTNQNYDSNRFLFDASWMNLRNITLGYTLPQKIINKIGSSRTRIYFTVDNLLLLTTNIGMEPNQNLYGISKNAYAPIKTFTAGIDVNF